VVCVHACLSSFCTVDSAPLASELCLRTLSATVLREHEG
jgi:hypothetical protein